MGGGGRGGEWVLALVANLELNFKRSYLRND